MKLDFYKDQKNTLFSLSKGQALIFDEKNEGEKMLYTNTSHATNLF